MSVVAILSPKAIIAPAVPYSKATFLNPVAPVFSTNAFPRGFLTACFATFANPFLIPPLKVVLIISFIIALEPLIPAFVTAAPAEPAPPVKTAPAANSSIKVREPLIVAPA